MWEMAGLAQVMQYEDDSLEAWFADGARILLTACGSAFTRQEDTTNGGLAHPPSGCGVHQFTAYAVQGWRERVRQLVIFRKLLRRASIPRPVSHRHKTPSGT